MKSFILITLLVIFYNCAGAQSSNDSVAVEVGDVETLVDSAYTDTSVHRNDLQNKSSLDEYRKDREFVYMNYLDSLLRATRDLKVDTYSVYNGPTRTARRQSSSATRVSAPQVNIFSIPFVKIILWVLAAFMIGFIIWKLFLGQSLFRKKSTQLADTTETPEEEMQDPSGYDALIAKAVRDNNFRLAVRYSYLQVLKKLSASGIIQFASDKTNYQYVNELRGKPYQQEFAALTLNYEYIWYGRFEIGGDTYRNIASDYKNFNSKIN